jgi:hypothetical protein
MFQGVGAYVRKHTQGEPNANLSNAQHEHVSDVSFLEEIIDVLCDTFATPIQVVEHVSRDESCSDTESESEDEDE